MPKSFGPESIKKSCSQNFYEKTKFTALCFNADFCTLKIDFLFHLEKMDIYFCPFFRSNPSYFLQKKHVFSNHCFIHQNMTG